MHRQSNLHHVFQFDLTTKLIFEKMNKISCCKFSTKLTFESYGPLDAARSVIFLHGILGNKRNWKTPANQFRLRHPDSLCLSVDLRGHGGSAGIGGHHDLEVKSDRDLYFFDEN